MTGKWAGRGPLPRHHPSQRYTETVLAMSTGCRDVCTSLPSAASALGTRNDIVDAPCLQRCEFDSILLQ
jgi:hypothetical protein